MKRITFFLGIILVCAIWSCQDRDDKLFGPNIRIQNLSDRDFSTVQRRNDSVVYENVAAGSFSNYIEYESAFEQDTLTIETDSLQLRFLPDSLSAPLPIGLYTYQVNIDENGEITLQFRLD